ncbi:MAG: ABC transporter ATP-binding protein, partial [Caldilineaceae bacterium]|nr:ABC transporter ATP-binding protein [Caldilineaceae bacterium]
MRKKRTVAVDDISFSIEVDEPAIHAVAGESGSGKSTLGLILMGFVKPTSGQVLYRGQDITRLNSAQQRDFRQEIQAVFQDPFSVYNPFYKVDHVLNVPIAKFKLADSGAAAKALIEEALTGVGLRPEETLGRYPHELSGGQRQRIMVARALLTRPKLIIADEPVSMVDASLRATILESLSKLNRDFGISIIYITHDLTTAYHVGDDILVLYQGSLAEAGNVELVIKQPQHPYTQLLINSIPWADLNRRWNETPIQAREAALNGNLAQGCKFADRCPQVMARCRTSAPLLYQTAPRRAT